MEIIKVIISIIISYLIGSIPFSYILCKKIKNIDIRTVGSRNAGATNAGRVLGKKWFFIITPMDAFKGFFVVFVTQYLMNKQVIIQHPLIPIAVGLFAIFGHTCSVYLHFQGGKGVAVSAGVLLALDYPVLLVGIIVFIFVALISKYISLGSILGSISVPFSIIFFNKNSNNYYLFVFGLMISFYVIYKHKENIKRLISGKEKKWGEKIKTK